MMIPRYGAEVVVVVMTMIVVVVVMMMVVMVKVLLQIKHLFTHASVKY